MIRYLLLSITALTLAVSTSAHSGRTAGDGCHNDSSTGVRHCHNDSAAEVSSVKVLIHGDTPSSDAGNTQVRSFSKAKKLLAEVYAGKQESFYCGCSYSDDGPNHDSCGFTPKKDVKRSMRIEWEHIVPAAQLAESNKAWLKGDPECVTSSGKTYRGRRCASKVDPEFQRMEADMYNLVPAIGEVNGLRSNYRYGEISGEAREFGDCDMEIRGRVAEPPPRVRGDIARTYLYMLRTYKSFTLRPLERKMFEDWANADPPDEWECERARRIEAIQGNRNEVVFDACLRN
jgi:deoxyribonuclease-1